MGGSSESKYAALDAEGKQDRATAPSSLAPRTLHLAPSRVLLLAAVLISPWLYGSVHEWSQVWLFLLLMPAMALTLAMQFLRRGSRNKLTPVMLILLLALALGGTQLLSLPNQVSAIASPQTAQLREQLLPNDTTADAELNRQLGVATHRSGQTISLRPESTRYDLALLALGVSAFYLATQLFATPKSQLWLYGLVAANGGLLAFFGLVQRMTWNDHLFWIGRIPSGGSPFASFVSRNSAGGYLNMCLAAALALAIWTMRRPGNVSAEKGSGTNRRNGPAGAGHNWFLTPFLHVDAQKILAVGLPALLFGGILCTASRGATVSALAAGALIAPVLIYFGRWRGRVVLILVVGLLGVGLVGWAGMQDLVQDRLGTLTDSEELSNEGRLLHWRDSIRAAPDFWRAGSGLGTYRDVYLMYEQHRFSSWFYHAENQYLEALIEGGIPGLLLMLSAIVCVALTTIRLLAHRRTSPAEFACAAAGLLALTTQVVHAFFDFSLYLAANMLLLAVICGASTSLRAARSRSGLLAPVVSILLLGCLVAGWHEIDQLIPVKQAQRDADFTIDPLGATQGELLAAMRDLQPLLRDDHAESHYVMAKLQIHLYRLKALDKLREEAPSDVAFDQLWEATSPEAIHRRIQQFERQRRSDELTEIKDDALTEQHLIPALKHLLQARSACPILSKVHLRIAPLSVLVDGPSADERHLQRACQLRPSSAYTWYKAGRLDMQAGRTEVACQRFRKCLQISPSYLPEVLAFASQHLSFKQVAMRALPQSPKFLLDTAKDHFGNETGRENRIMLAGRALVLLESNDAPEPERQHLIGRAFTLEERYKEALRAYLFAVQERPNIASWRYELSVLLLREGHVDEAFEQAQKCLRIEPQNVEYQRHLTLLRQRRFAASQP